MINKLVLMVWGRATDGDVVIRIDFFDQLVNDMWRHFASRSEDPEWLPDNPADVTLDTLGQWAADDAQWGFATEVPFDPPETRAKAEAIVNDALDQCPISEGRAGQRVTHRIEHELTRTWRGRFVDDFDDIYGEEGRK